jgi:4a-hydroxytetrahydrobiopterin dehydratase
MTDISNQETCVPCALGDGQLSQDQIDARFDLLTGWELASDNIKKRFEFKGFAKAVELANLAAWHSNKMGHHADIAFGWGYCEVTYTSHEAGGLTANDFICARKFDELLS